MHIYRFLCDRNNLVMDIADQYDAVWSFLIANKFKLHGYDFKTYELLIFTSFLYTSVFRQMTANNNKDYKNRLKVLPWLPRLQICYSVTLQIVITVQLINGSTVRLHTVLAILP